MFVHCYLGLIKNGAGPLAREFFDKASQHFMENYYDEVVALSLVTNKDQLNSDEFIVNNSFV